jgi:tRNA(Ile)-lysidine synthase
MLIRPLLALSRDVVTAFLDSASIQAAKDPTNDDRRFLRTRLRKDVLPLLRGERRGLDSHLSALAIQLQEDDAYLTQLAEQAFLRATLSGGALDVAQLRVLPGPILARVFLRFSGPLSTCHIDALRGLCKTDQGSQNVILGQGRWAERRYGALFLRREETEKPQEGPLWLPGPGRYAFSNVVLQIGVAPCPGPPKSSTTAVFLLPQAGFPLHLRHWQPGDRIAIGGGRHQKVSDVLINAKVPKAQRGKIVLLCAGEAILWIVGHRIAPTLCVAEAEDVEVLVARWLNPGE